MLFLKYHQPLRRVPRRRRNRQKASRLMVNLRLRRVPRRRRNRQKASHLTENLRLRRVSTNRCFICISPHRSQTISAGNKKQSGSLHGLPTCAKFPDIHLFNLTSKHASQLNRFWCIIASINLPDFRMMRYLKFHDSRGPRPHSSLGGRAPARQSVLLTA